MKIVFVQPAGTGQPHLGIMYLIGVLKDHGYTDVHFVSLTDPPVSEMRSREYLVKLLEQRPEIVGVTASSPEWAKTEEICKLSKEYSENVMVGGPHPSIYKEKLLEKYPFIDQVIVGEADNTIHKIVAGIENGTGLDGIPGVAYRENGRIIMNEPNPLIEDLDPVPFPDRDCLDMRTYHSPFTIFTSRGCPYGCIFCFKPVHGNVFRGRSPENVVDEIEFLLDKYPDVAQKIGRKIGISDDVFNFDIDRAKKICDEIIKRDLNIELSCVNGFHVRNVDYELFQKMKKAGFTEVWFGVDSGNPEILKKIKKGITVDMVRNAVKLARKAGIRTIGAHFIIGLVDETPETARDSIRLAKELKLDVVGFNHANILPGTRLWDWVMEHGTPLYPMDDMDFTMYKQLSGIPVFETPEFSADERRKVYSEAIAFGDTIWRKKALSPRSIVNLLVKLRSPADILWALKKFKFFLLEKDLAIKGFPNQPSIKKNKE